MIFRPYKRNIHNFIDLLLMLFLGLINILCITDRAPRDYNIVFQLIIFGVINFGYFQYWTCTKICICFQSFKANRKRNTPNNKEDEDMEIMPVDNDDWITDRMENLDDYNEHHVQYVSYDLQISQPEDITVRATCGSVSSPESTGTCNLDIDLLSTKDTQSTVAVSDKLSIPLHPIASEPDDATSITVNEDIV